jgi:predicted enzyme related to lactoylglutathione lyase
MSHEGAPVEYFEIPSDNIGELKKFYSQLFTWSFEEGESEDYWLIKNAGILGGISKRRTNEQSPTIFVTVKSIDDMLQKSQEHGAQVLVNKHEIREGYFAVLKDPQNNVFGIWQEKNDKKENL